MVKIELRVGPLTDSMSRSEYKLSRSVHRLGHSLHGPKARYGAREEKKCRLLALGLNDSTCEVLFALADERAMAGAACQEHIDRLYGLVASGEITNERFPSTISQLEEIEMRNYLRSVGLL